MKKLIQVLILGLLILSFQCCEKEELTGGICGTVTDKATGEPVRSACVELNPSGLKTITGSEGQFEFADLTAGNYTLFITKTGYADFASSTINVKPGQTAKEDVQIELLSNSIYGMVLDADNNTPLQGAMLTLSPGGGNRYTGSDGNYIFEDLNALQYTIMVQLGGYHTDRKIVNLMAGGQQEVTFVLRKN